MRLAVIFAAGPVRHMSVHAGGRTATGTDSVRACQLSPEGQVYETSLSGSAGVGAGQSPGHVVTIAGWAASFHGLAAGQVPDLRELTVRS